MLRSRSLLMHVLCCVAALMACSGRLQAQELLPASRDEGTQKTLDLFKAITQIPRCSGREGDIGEWLKAWGKTNGYKVDGGQAGNVFIRVPASAGYEKAPVIVLQTHMDMVCEKTSGSAHDFSKDPIIPMQEGDWLKADQTSLGADDGIGMALALSIAQDRNLAHPPLELIFTTAEETTGAGVDALNKRNVDGKVLINLDSEWEGVLIIGDWTSERSLLSVNMKSEAIPADFAVCSLVVDGLRGGHSGVDITKNRANAIKVLTRALDVIQKMAEVRLVSVTGGTVRNAIPRAAKAQIALPGGSSEQIQKTLNELKTAILKECPGENAGFEILLQSYALARPKTAFSKDETIRLTSLLLALPNGVLAMDARFPGLPETSTNIGIIQTMEDGVRIDSMPRGSSVPELLALNQTIASIAAAHGSTVKVNEPGPPWQGDMNSDVLKRNKEAYLRLFGKAPIVSIAPGGLECGAISKQCGGLDVISIGPEIENPHSPDERVSITSIKKVRELVAAVLTSYK